MEACGPAHHWGRWFAARNQKGQARIKTVNGIHKTTTGGAKQTIVVDRSQFTLPVKIDTIRT